jgi:hypothetical protein
MTEIKYAFIKDNRVEQVLLFDLENSALADQIKIEQNFDSYVKLEADVTRHSSYDGTTFTPPTIDYLYSIGVSQYNQAHLDQMAAEAALAATENTE